MAQPRLELSFDIWVLVTDILGAEMKRSGPYRCTALKALSRTCKALLPECRRNLFATLSLPYYDFGGNPHLSRINSDVSRNPEFIQYVQHFEYHITPPQEDYFDEIIDIIRDRSTILKSIRIQVQTCKNWDAYPTSVQNSLEQLIRVPTVTHLYLTGLTQVPPYIPASCSNLDHLGLKQVEFIQTRDAGPFLRPRPVSFEGNIIDPYCLKAIDFTGVKEMSLHSYIEERKFIWDLIQNTTTFEDLYLRHVYPGEIAGLGAALSIHAISTLKRLSLSINANRCYNPPLCGLVPELSRISGNNVLAEISLHATVGAYDMSHRPDKKDWCDFDSLITASESFPKLKLVSITISWETGAGEATEQEVFDRVTETHFPELLEHDTITFRLSIDNCFSYPYDDYD